MPASLISIPGLVLGAVVFVILFVVLSVTLWVSIVAAVAAFVLWAMFGGAASRGSSGGGDSPLRSARG